MCFIGRWFGRTHKIGSAMTKAAAKVVAGIGEEAAHQITGMPDSHSGNGEDVYLHRTWCPQHGWHYHKVTFPKQEAHPTNGERKEQRQGMTA